MPSAVHGRSDGRTLIADLTTWWSSRTLFVSETSGQPTCRERGLLHLLQAGLVGQELQHVAHERDEPSGRLAESILRVPSVCHDIQELLVREAVNHSEALEIALDSVIVDDGDDPTEPILGLEQYDAVAVDFGSTITSHNERLLRDESPTDAHTRTIHTSLALDARDVARVQEHAVVRLRQNKDNRQRTGVAHPPRPSQRSATVPNLAFVNEVTLPDVSDTVLPSKRRPKKKTVRPKVTVRPGAVPRTNVHSRPTRQVENDADPMHTQRATDAPTRGRKRPAATSGHTAPRKKPRGNIRLPSPSETASDDEQECFDLHGISGEDSEEENVDAGTPVVVDPGLSEHAYSSRRRRGSVAMLSDVGGLQPVSFSTEDSSPAPIACPPRPRPRRIVPGAQGAQGPGISTSFEPFRPQQARQSTGDPPTRGRRSSLRSSTSKDSPDCGGRRTPSGSRSVHFADEPPATRTRSKSRTRSRSR